MLAELSLLDPLVQLVAKATALLVVTSLATVLLGKRSAALRHLLWLCCAMGLLALPVLTLVLPPLKLPVLSLAIGESDAEASGLATNAVTTHDASKTLSERPAGSPRTGEQRNSSENTPAAAVTNSSPSAKSMGKSASQRSSTLILALIWFAGTALLLTARLAGDRYLSRIIANCRPVESTEPASSLLAECAAILGAGKPRLLTSQSAPLPFACGSFRSAIILPDAATEWDAGKLRPVLMHEMAHIKRHDCLTQFVAHCARALFWFHPLSWWMTRQMHLEREIACDDLVLQAGHEPARYGKILLRLATEVDSPGYLPTGAIAMAGKSTLERRLGALIDPLRNRSGVSRRILVAALGMAALIAASLAVLQVVRGSADPNIELANQPHKLRSLPTEKLIRIGVSEPELPWAWQELRTRAENGKLTSPEADSLMTALTFSMHRKPNGYERPLNWLQELIQTLQARRLISEAKVLEFLKVCQGSPTPPRLPRLRETDKTLPLAVDWRNVWYQDLFGFVLLNEMRSVTIDAQAVEVRGSSRGVRHPEFRGDVQLPPLAPGKHTLRCEILSTLVAKTDAIGLANDAPSETWPPARVRWTRTVETDLMVYGKDAEIVRLTEDPTLDPKVTGGLSVEKIIVRRTQKGSQAVVIFNLSDSLAVPIGFDVALQIGGRTYKPGHLLRAPIHTGSGQGITYSGTESTITIEALAPEVQTANLVLTPNPAIMERLPDVERTWGKQVTLTQVPLARHDLLANMEAQVK